MNKSNMTDSVVTRCHMVTDGAQGQPAGQGRAGQGMAGQGRAGQGRAGQGRAGHLSDAMTGR